MSVNLLWKTACDSLILRSNHFYYYHQRVCQIQTSPKTKRISLKCIPNYIISFSKYYISSIWAMNSLSWSSAHVTFQDLFAFGYVHSRGILEYEKSHQINFLVSIWLRMAFCYKKVIQYSASFTIHAARVFPIFANKVLHLKKFLFCKHIAQTIIGWCLFHNTWKFWE